MDRLVFTSLSGAKTGTIQRTMLTDDLANVSTVGFKRASFQRAVPAQLDGPGFAVRFQPLVENRTDVVDLKAGTRIDTGNPLDVAFNGQTVMGVTRSRSVGVYTKGRSSGF